MEIDSVRSLKREVLETIVNPALDSALQSRTFAFAAKSTRTSSKVVPAVALGIARGKTRRDFKLAVRLQQRPIGDVGDLQEKLHGLARGEIDFRYIGRATKQQGNWQTSRQRPLLIGSSGGHFAITAGTIGGFPTSRKNGKTMILSNNHVLANENRARIGDAILQPGTIDGGVKNSDSVAVLADFIPLKLDGANMMDAAVATIDDAVTCDRTTLTGSPPATLKGLRGAVLDIGDEVYKLGRTTGLTRGLVSAIEVDDVVVDYEIGNLRFDRQTEIEGADNVAFSEGGDSGSLVFDTQGFAAALLFAGTDQGGSNGRGLTYASDLASVLDALDLKLEI